jgi:hypothetical protein
MHIEQLTCSNQKLVVYKSCGNYNTDKLRAGVSGLAKSE